MKKQKEFRELSVNRRKAIVAFLDPDVTCIADIAEKTTLQVNTLIKFTGEADFMRILQNAKRALDTTGAGPDV